MSSWPSRSHLRAPSARATASGNGSASRTSCVTPPGNRYRARALSAADWGFSAAHRATAPSATPPTSRVAVPPLAAVSAVSFLTATAHPPGSSSTSSLRAADSGTQPPSGGRGDAAVTGARARQTETPSPRARGVAVWWAWGRRPGRAVPEASRPIDTAPGPPRLAVATPGAADQPMARHMRYGTIGRRQRHEVPRGRLVPAVLLLPDARSGGQPVRAVTFTGAGGNEVVAVA